MGRPDLHNEGAQPPRHCAAIRWAGTCGGRWLEVGKIGTDVRRIFA